MNPFFKENFLTDCLGRCVKTYKGMHLASFLFLFIAVQAYARAEAQTITLQRSNITLTQALTEIKKQSQYSFFWSDQLVRTAPRINVNIRNYPLREALDDLLKGLPYSYRIENKFVYIIPKQGDQATGNPVQQQVANHGKVTDSADNPIAGVSVINKRLNKGGATDSNGVYTISAAPGDVLQFSHIGYRMKEVTVGHEEIINIQLLAENNTLSDIVIVGYGTQQRKDVTGAIASIGPKELKQSPVANISNALAGRLPGLITVQNSGEPGADGSALYIRGFGTTGNNSPLVLVDGIERDFSNLDPNEVGNITILKDAASTAIYGIRGANGVILITTRRGAN